MIRIKAMKKEKKLLLKKIYFFRKTNGYSTIYTTVVNVTILGRQQFRGNYRPKGK